MQLRSLKKISMNANYYSYIIQKIEDLQTIVVENFNIFKFILF